MANNSQSRKWLMVLNNPIEYGFTHVVIKEKLLKFAPIYFCMADEIASTGTFHTHVFIFATPIRFSTLKARFPIAHIEKAYGSAEQNREYIRKEGKWSESEKSETSIAGSFEEWGNLPTEKSEKNPIQSQLILDVEEGKRTAEIVRDIPALVFKIKEIETLRQTMLKERYDMENRELMVTYLFGKTGVGKTKSIFAKYPANEICRITSYRKNGIYFDNYSTQNVLVFEEFYSQIPIEDMLNYLDIYPLSLPARYSDRVACYTKVYITSNIPLEEQYLEVQYKHPETWKAFLRRIHEVIELKNSIETEVL